VGSSRCPRGLAAVAAVVAVALAVAATACGSGPGSTGGGQGSVPAGRPVVVVTTPVLGAVVADLVGEAATVEVIMPPGVDPHDYQPSARDAEVLAEADLVVVNGLELEEGLEDAIDEAGASGVPVFVATDHLPRRALVEGGGEHAEDEHAGDEHAGDEHAHGGSDPHFWVDPVAMGEVVADLAPALRDELGLDVAARAAEVGAELAALDAEVGRELAAVPGDRRLLVTSHDSMGWFADRYGFTVVGALVPSLSSQGSASAGEIGDPAHQVEELGVPAIFLEVGTPASLADTIAEQTGAVVVELPSHNLPEDGSYASFVRGIAQRVRQGLGS
jgi:zinc/manganese transport system substrate-binding protein